jgi:hypothetical protein
MIDKCLPARDDIALFDREFEGGTVGASRDERRQHRPDNQYTL